MEIHKPLLNEQLSRIRVRPAMKKWLILKSKEKDISISDIVRSLIQNAMEKEGCNGEIQKD